eukprot:jgi/Orpsp1_1/1184451/evm.model.c7180000089578.1
MVEVAMSDVYSVYIFKPDTMKYVKPFQEKVQSLVKEFNENNYDDPSKPEYDYYGYVNIISNAMGDSFLHTVIMPPYVAKKVKELPEVKYVIKDMNID